MKILVSTKETQGQRKNDFCFVPENEPVRFGFECDGEEIDGHCGCKRALCGCHELTATTTFKVIDSDFSEESYLKMIENSLEKSGFSKEDGKSMAEELSRVAEQYSIGTILEKRGNNIQNRLQK